MHYNFYNKIIVVMSEPQLRENGEVILKQLKRVHDRVNQDMDDKE